MFDTNFDNQKLMYHPAEVARWLRTGRTRGPLYTEMELCSSCNCRCVFCAVDYLVNKSHDRIDVDLAHKVIDGLHALGNKSVMFCGHGEPLLHSRAGEIIADCSRRMSTSLTTNGLALTADRTEIIDALEWVRFSINGCSAENYAAIHGVSAEMFERVMGNVAAAVERKRRDKLDVVIGAQLVLLQDNADGAVDLARRLKDIGVDYFSVKPYSQHPLRPQRLEVDYSRFESLGQELASLQNERFKVIYRRGSMSKAGAAKPYRRCYGTHFLSFVSATGDVWECNVFAGDERFLIGNAQAETMSEIWTGPRRRQVLAYIANEMSIDGCRDICRMDECNRYLWRLRHPRPHDNFI
ncbi:MAG: radical SAM protein [Planctomycetaceae bacterium]|nr:radical SAM protein [Planctomycetaceae bacterium]